MKNILKRPIVTEKVAKQQDKGLYAFEVDRSATKLQIKDAVERMFNVQVSAVNTMVMPAKPKYRHTSGGVIAGQTSVYKKAIVRLMAGEMIDLYDTNI
jgi:large subunit ribosomal protein L23